MEDDEAWTYHLCKICRLKTLIILLWVNRCYPKGLGVWGSVNAGISVATTDPCEAKLILTIEAPRGYYPGDIIELCHRHMRNRPSAS